MQPENIRVVRLGIPSHNLFDLRPPAEVAPAPSRGHPHTPQLLLVVADLCIADDPQKQNLRFFSFE
jgi:hypothetical protein